MKLLTIIIAIAVVGLAAQSEPRFEVASIKPTAPDYRGGKFVTMQSPRRFLGRNYTVKSYVATAFGLTLKTVIGGPKWF